MEDLRSAEQEGPSPSEACQIRREKEGGKTNHCYWDSLEPQQTQQFVVYTHACVCVCQPLVFEHINETEELASVVLSCFHHRSLFYNAPKPRLSPNNFNESEDPGVSWERRR